MTRSLATEFASRGFAPTRSRPASSGPIPHGASYEGMAELHPLGRMTEISDIVDGIVYLERAGFVTGQRFTSIAARRLALAAVSQMISNHQHSVRSD